MKRIVSAVVFSALTLGLMAPMVHAADAPAAGATQKPAAVVTGTTGTAGTPVVKAAEQKPGEVKQDVAKPATAATAAPATGAATTSPAPATAGTPVVKAGDQKPGEAKATDVKTEGVKAGEVKPDAAAKPAVKPAS